MFKEMLFTLNPILKVFSNLVGCDRQVHATVAGGFAHCFHFAGTQKTERTVKCSLGWGGLLTAKSSVVAMIAVLTV